MMELQSASVIGSVFLNETSLAQLRLGCPSLSDEGTGPEPLPGFESPRRRRESALRRRHIDSLALRS